MLKKGFPSPLLTFEESLFYPLCKLLFHLERHAQPVMSVDLVDHRVFIRFRNGTHEFFTWELGVEDYLKGIRGGGNRYWDHWQQHTHFGIRRQSLPLTYRIGFTAANDLEIEPMLHLGGDHYAPVAHLEMVSKRNLYFHEKLGYFGMQTGLSPFEMTWSEPGVHQVDAQDVKKFLEEHRETLESMDRSQMDEGLFGEVVVDGFDHLDVNLEQHGDGGFTITMGATLDEHTLGIHQLVDLFTKQKGRYRKIGGKLIDSAGYDSVFLSSLLGHGQTNLDSEDLARLSAGDLLRLLALFKDRLHVNVNELTATIYDNLRNFKAPTVPSLEHTKLKLRPYQDVGYQWLYFLKSYGLGGLLCDQMGLGKTHQAMALIAAVQKQIPTARILVVSPTTVIYHWRDKLKDFCPELEVGIHHGPDRDLEITLKHARVIISTYGTLRNDAPQLQQSLFELVVFDEIQNLKNKDTKRYKSLSTIQAHCKIGLTGTPIENNVGELKNLLDLVFPGFLGSDAHFKRFFVEPITKFNDTKAKDRMRTMVSPFTLRRSKAQVLTDLPEKTEDLRSFKMSAYEMDLYESVRNAGKKDLKKGEKSTAYTRAFQLVQTLKQICNHPGLYFKNFDYKAYPSTKWDMFTELLEEALMSGEKVVVFTQYLGMLDMFEAYLEDRGVSYALIKGATKDREHQQKRFQTDASCRVFLGSLNAAGVGIDLTAASILFHYDRWWNPAREEQATDRIHRIGQKNPCQIFKFRAMGTVESRIDAIIRRKAALLQDVIGFDSSSIAKSISLEELLEVLN